jgi:molecular chaperone HscA
MLCRVSANWYQIVVRWLVLNCAIFHRWSPALRIFALTFQVDADGLLNVFAQETSSGVEASITVKPSYGLGDGEIARMLQDSFTHAKDDMQARKLNEQRVDAKRMVENLRSALQADGQLLDEKESELLHQMLVSLEQQQNGTVTVL